MKKIYFVSNNDYKGQEISKLIEEESKKKVLVECVKCNILEKQTDNIEQLVRQKVIEAYKKVGRPVIVDHTAFEVDAFNKLPGALTSVFWNRLKCKGFLKLFRNNENTTVTAVTVLAYCDGKRIRIFKGKQNGNLSDAPKGKSKFQWDPIFIPEGETKTFAELGEKKHKYSMRKKAIKKLVAFLKKEASDCNNDGQDIIKEIAKTAKAGRLILFIGAGVSSTIVELKWGDLIEKLGESLGYEKGLFSVHGNYYELGEYYKNEKGSHDELIKIIKQSYSNIDSKIEKSNIYKNICEIGAKTIYTTNYDDILEKAHKLNGIEYDKIIGIDDFWKAAEDHVKIIKFHGDVSDDKTIVFSESSYFSRVNMDSAIDHRLMSDILENSVLFLGYSLKDLNVRNMLYRMEQHYAKNGTETTKRPKLYFFTSEDNSVRTETLRRWNVYTILSDKRDKLLALEEFLKTLVDEIKK